ncbi:MAG: hypothetical protein HC804_10660 [Anaerolineae bacterium]|nr:hypothetical protein [Anaerolineae bacterium]
MDNQVQNFLLEAYKEGSYYHSLQQFLTRRIEKGLSAATIARLFYNLHRIGNGRSESLDNPPIDQLSRAWLKSYVKACWLSYAPDTMRTMIGDIRQFFKWLKTTATLLKTSPSQ